MASEDRPPVEVPAPCMKEGIGGVVSEWCDPPVEVQTLWWVCPRCGTLWHRGWREFSVDNKPEDRARRLADSVARGR